MTTITMPKKEYARIIKTQEQLSSKLNVLTHLFKQELGGEIRPEYAKKLNRISKDLNKGKGTRLLSANEAKNFLDNL